MQCARRNCRSARRQSRHRLLGCVWCAILSTATSCDAPQPWPTREEDLRALDDPWLPPDAVRFFVTFDAGSHPAWRVRASDGDVRCTNELQARAGVPMVLLLRSDTDVRLEIPAMRIRKSVTAGAPTVAWFMPLSAGEYPIAVRSVRGPADGRLTVSAASAPR